MGTIYSEPEKARQSSLGGWNEYLLARQPWLLLEWLCAHQCINTSVWNSYRANMSTCNDWYPWVCLRHPRSCSSEHLLNWHNFLLGWPITSCRRCNWLFPRTLNNPQCPLRSVRVSSPYWKSLSLASYWGDLTMKVTRAFVGVGFADFVRSCLR